MIKMIKRIKPKKTIKSSGKKRVGLTRSHKIKSSYLKVLFDTKYSLRIKELVKVARKIKRKHPFDAIAFTGMSGAGVAFPLSFLLKVPLILIRKKGYSHSSDEIEGTYNSKRYLIVDDFIDSGETINKIIRTYHYYSPAAKPVAMLLYAEDEPRKRWGKIPVFIPVFHLKK